MSAFPSIPVPDAQARRAVAAALASSPRGVSLGRLGEIAAWLASCQATVPAQRPRSVRAVVFAGHHGVAQREFEGAPLSAYLPEADEQILRELTGGVGPSHTAARCGEASIKAVPTEPSAPIDKGPAMSFEQYQRALQLGAAEADRAIDEGADLLIPADLGVGATTVAGALMGALTATEPVAIVGPGSGISDAMWKTKVRAIRDAMYQARNLDTEELLQVCSSPSTAAMVGFIIQAASRRTPMLVDAPLVAVAACFAERLAPGTAAWLCATDASEEPAHALALQDLGLTPLFALGISTGQGLGALSALPRIAGAVELVADEVAVAAEAGASTPSEPVNPEPE